MAAPKIDYLSRDFQGIKDSLLTYASATFPEWQPGSQGDFGMVMLDLFSYVGDVLSYYTDRAQFENYIGTATQRESVLGLAYLLGYLPNSGTPATGTVSLVTSAGMPVVTVPAGTQITTVRVPEIDGPLTFETNATVTLAANGGTNAPIAVTEGTTETYVKIGESSGAPSQAFLLPHDGVYRDTVRVFVEDPLGSTVFTTGVTPVTTREWLMVDHLLDSDETDGVFETQFVGDSMSIVFGDDINGTIPASGIAIYASYRHGYGAFGNVAAGTVRLINDRTLAGVTVARDPVTDVYQSSAMTGGTDPEDTDSIRYNAPRAYRTQDRVVTTQDIVDLALGVEGVTKANVVVGTFTSVTLYVTGADGGAPSQSLMDAVTNQLAGKTLAGVTVTVASPTFVTVNVGAAGANAIQITLWPQYSQAAVQAAVEREIRTAISNLAFGQRLTVSMIYDAIGNVDGVRYVEIPMMARSDATQSGTVALQPRPWEIFTPGTIVMSLTGGVA